MNARINVSRETTGFRVKKDTISHIEKAMAAWPLGKPPLKGVPLLNMAFIIIIPTKTIDIIITDISEPSVLIIFIV